jgi:hypothetical protein
MVGPPEMKNKIDSQVKQGFTTYLLLGENFNQITVPNGNVQHLRFSVWDLD